jgi:hypothetical protein
VVMIATLAHVSMIETPVFVLSHLKTKLMFWYWWQESLNANLWPT